MRLFKRTPKGITQDELAQKIAGNIISRQRRIADCLNRRVKNLPAKYRLLILTGFCTLFGSYCFYLLINALN